MKKVISIILLVFAVSCTNTFEKTLIFSSNRSGNSDIYSMNIETFETKQLTNSTDEEWGPTWMTATKISFLRQEKDKIIRYKLNLNSGELTEISHPENCILDDKNILYAADGELQLYQCKSNIYLFDETTGNTINITKDMDGFSRYPGWSFDKKTIIFTNDRSGNNDVYTYNLQTKIFSQLTNFPSNDERGELSPDNKYLVFSSNKFEADNQDILLKNMETGAIENITNSKGNELIARWSPDGTQIYFGGNTDGNWEIYRYNVLDKSTQRITDNTAFDGDPRVYKK